MSLLHYLRGQAAWLAGGGAALATLAAIVLLVISVRGGAGIGFGSGGEPTLGEGETISAWIELDKPSYLQGDIVRYRVLLLWDADAVRPNLDSFESSVSFYPLEKLAVRSAEQPARGSLREYSAEFTLQGVNVDAPAEYRLDTATVYYSSANDGHAEVQALRVNPPPLYFGEFFPADVADISLLPYKGPLDEAGRLRGSLMAALGATALSLLALMLWLRGRRRPERSLSPAEILWREFEPLRRAGGEARPRLLACERIFTRALELRAGMSAAEFWSARDLESRDAGVALAAAREAFMAAYRPEGPGETEVTAVVDSIDALLGPMVREELLRRELQDSPVERLRGQPRLLGYAALLAVTGAAALVLAAVPGTWVPADIRSYNTAARQLESGDDLQGAYDAFVALAENAADVRVQAAALYNAAGLMVDPRLAGLSRERFDNFRNAIFLPDVTLDRFLHDMEMDAEFELVTLLTELTRRYVQAEQAMRAAVRVAPGDGDARRNLEILSKIRRAIGRSLSSMTRPDADSSGSQQMVSQAVIDLMLLMEAELPDDFAKQDEGKDDRDYFILEKF